MARLWPIAAGFAVLDAAARALIAHRVGGSVLQATLALPLAFAVALFALGAARAARSDGLAIAVPFVGLLTIGDIVAARLAEGQVTTRAELLTVCAVATFVLTLNLVRDTAALQPFAESLGVMGAVLIALSMAPVIGQTIGGQSGWIAIGGLQVSPAELGRPLVLLGFAAALARAPLVLRDRREWYELRPVVGRALFLPGVAVATHVLERDLGAALLLALALAGVLAIAVGRMALFGAAAAAAFAALVAAALLSARLQGRLLDVVHPLRLVDGSYDQAGLAHLALAWGGWHGVGFGGGLTAPHKGFVPAAGSDYVLAQWALEAGLIGLVAAMVLFGWLLATAWTWTLRAPVGFSRLAAGGLTWLLTISTIWTAGAVLGVLPLSGLPSPFIAGASNATGMAVGVALLCRTASQGESERVVPSATLRLGRLTAVASIALLTLLALHRVDTQRLELNRRIDNPWRQWSTLNRGKIVARGGETLAHTTGAASLDTVGRSYAHTSLTGGIVGHVSFVDQDGGGLESAWRAVLRCGGSGQATPIGTAWARGAMRVAGNPADCRPAGIAVSLDLRVQAAVERAFSARHGAVVVLDARSGAVLAAAGHLRSPRRPAPQAAFDLLVAPGSTFKIVTAAAALAAGVSTGTPLASGYSPEPGRWLPNAGGEVCGGSLLQAFAHSCNSSFARIGISVGQRQLAATAARFGFGVTDTVSGVAVAPSAFGDTAADAPSALADASIGQGRLVATPLQMALVGATIARDGLRPQPTLVDAVCGVERVVPVAHRVIAAPIAGTIREAMRAATLTGTGRAAARTPGAWALKTGTAEVPHLRQTRTPSGTAGWIVGFPTAPTAHGIVPVVAGVVLPDDARRQRSGPTDGVGLLDAVAGAALRARPRRSC